MRCDSCGKFRSGPWKRLPVTQADYLFGDADPRYICAQCADQKGTEQ